MKALVIVPNERTRDMRSLVNIAAAEAKRREGTCGNIYIKTVRFIPECCVFVALYEWGHKASDVRGRKARGR